MIQFYLILTVVCNLLKDLLGMFQTLLYSVLLKTHIAVDNNGNTLKSGQQLSICHYDTLRCTYGVVLHTGMYHLNRRPPKDWNGLL